MIKAIELKIGNYLFDREDRLCKVEAIDLAFIDSVVGEAFKAPAIIGGLTALPHKPIELTETWLEKFGFKMVAGNAEKDNYLLWKNKTTHNFDFVLNEPHSNKRIVTPIKYVHQLQNLYYALTNEELKPI